MIIDFFKNTMLGSLYQAIHIHFTENEGVEYNILTVKRAKYTVNILQTYSVSSLQDALSELSNNLPTVLSFTGKGILSRKIKNSTNYHSKLIFNADYEDFFWQEQIYETYIFASVGRKLVVKNEIEKLQKEGVLIVDIAIGSFAIASVKSLIEKDVIYSVDTKLIFEEGKLVEFDDKQIPVTVNYSIGNETLSNKQILNFASILNYFYPKNNLRFDGMDLSKNRENSRYKRWFKVFGTLVLASFFIVLLISFLTLNYYQNKQQEIQHQIDLQNLAYSKLISLEKDKNNKTLILKESGVKDGSYLSFYVSQIVADLPVEMNLIEINVFPPVNKIKKNEKIVFDNDLIEIQGTVSNYTALTVWITKLKMFAWIASVEIIEFRKENRLNSFNIKLTLNFDV